MIHLDPTLSPADLQEKIDRLWKTSATKIRSIQGASSSFAGAPVYTQSGKYTSRGWTEWTQGFQIGSALLQFDATGEEEFLTLGRSMTMKLMVPHITHIGVHDHGFNNISTFGNLLRLMNEGRIPEDEWERSTFETALKCSGAVQASRWTTLPDNRGFIYSFNGPHSLFADTIRTLRSLAVSHALGHYLLGENDRRISLLERLVSHAHTTAQYAVYYGEGRDAYDVWGRTAHESIFNVNDGMYRCPSTQQGYSPWSTWTRGLAWVMCGFAELLEYLPCCAEELTVLGGFEEVESMMLKACRASCDFYLANTPSCGVPYWDTAAPGLANLGAYLEQAANPFNEDEPVDSSAAAIAAQGLLRLGRYLDEHHEHSEDGQRYFKAGLKILDTLLEDPYLSTDPEHQGLLLHAVYHRPKGWDYVPPGRSVPCGEATMWGDYHLREATLYVQRIIRSEPYLTFFGPIVA